MSILEQWFVCQRLAPEKEKAQAMGRAAARERVEYGAPITQGYTLGPTVKGKPGRVEITRPRGAAGTAHTHLGPELLPSETDLWGAFLHGDQATCIIEASVVKPKTRCFYPKRVDDFLGLAMATKVIDGRMDDYLAGLKRRYGEPVAKTGMERLEGQAIIYQVERMADTLKRAEKDVLGECAI